MSTSNGLALDTGAAQRPRALADLNYNGILHDVGTSSDEEGLALAAADRGEARVLDVSIGREQTRLTSPKTPALEKAAAIDRTGGFFGDSAADDGLSGIEGEEAKQVVDVDGIDERGHVSPPVEELPSPWRAGPRIFERSSAARQSLRDGFASNRKRSNSGPESWSKQFMSSLPSMPKNFSFTSPFSNSTDTASSANSGSRKRSSSILSGSFQWSTIGGSSNTSNTTLTTASRRPGSSSNLLRRISSPREEEEAQATIHDLPSRPEIQSLRSRASQLRRSASDDSLVTYRTMSNVSFGDDSRFENVSDMVNSRMKAIKDSWQDSSIKLPSMPSIATFRADFLRDRPSFSSNDRSVTPNGRPRNGKPIDPLTRQPYHSTRAAIADNKIESNHPHFDHALAQLEGDIVVLGGYRGSILRSAEPPHRQLWVPIKVGLNIRKVDLEVGLNEEEDELATKKIIPGGMLTHIGPIDISRRLLKRLRRCNNAVNGKLRVHEYGYDWRLDPNHLSRQLQAFLETLPCNSRNTPEKQRGAIVVAHSLGGLITRHSVNMRPDLFSGVVYAGVPQTCVNILGPIRNGDDVLLSSRVLTAQVNFTIRTSFALLPLDGRCFIDKTTKEEYPVDFFDVQTWIDHRLSPCLGRPLPSLNGAPEPTGITGYMASVAKALPTLPIPGRKASKSTTDAPATVSSIAEPDVTNTSSTLNSHNNDTDTPPTVSTLCTIPYPDAIAYLTRTLASVKRFKQELDHIPTHTYPPHAVIYGKSTPTVYGAKVDGKGAIKHASAYDDLAFASGDGVVLARASMLPEGYKAARGSVVSSERGHVTLLGDLDAVGRCLNAVVAGRRRGAAAA